MVHQTIAGSLTRASVLTRYGGKRNKGHVYILKSGEAVFLWDFEEKLIRATKAESPDVFSPTKGQFPGFSIAGKLIYVEIDYEERTELRMEISIKPLLRSIWTPVELSGEF